MCIAEVQSDSMWNIVQQISVDVAALSEASLEKPTVKNRTLPDGFRAAEACVEPSPSKTAVPVAMLVWKFRVFCLLRHFLPFWTFPWITQTSSVSVALLSG
jgi:hypothetical protein